MEPQQGIIVDEFNREVYCTTLTTQKRLLAISADAFTLYNFYLYTSQRQSKRMNKQINQIKATDTFCIKGLKGWGKQRFYKAKKELIDSKLAEKVLKRENGKADGWYIRIFTFVSPQNQTPANQTLTSQTLENRPQILNEYKLNTEYIERNTEGKKKKTDNALEEYKSWLQAYNEITGKTFKSLALIENFKFWRQYYSLEEMKDALKNISRHDWLSDKHKPELILRRTDTNKNPVDRIGELLSLTTIRSLDRVRSNNA